ncbi:hypothetical protein [Streptomyces sp. CS014]|uniref:hypothetical protein n=1 Tax=Streptomyces sp. CS014 TaxID=2162707 RepID=UPI000D50D79C|nr:hypothetical protein [Streptomyces sp. CS014]PVD04451.1 hypothetical protein DBP12_03230 [Streptomyces sp. CS014]
MREIVVRCDAEHDETPRPQAQVVDISILVSDPTHTVEPREIRGTVEICPGHTEPVDVIESLLSQHGVPLTEKARNRLVAVPASEYAYCWTCPDPKRLKKVSLPSHCDKQHGQLPGNCDIRTHGKD